MLNPEKSVTRNFEFNPSKSQAFGNNQSLMILYHFFLTLEKSLVKDNVGYKLKFSDNTTFFKGLLFLKIPKT